MQAAICPVFGQKGIVATLFGDAVLGDDNDAVGIADGNTTAFQLVKAYTSGAQTWTRSITKPVDETELLDALSELRIFKRT